MDLKLHANATTTPLTRAYIQASTASAAEPGVSETTIRRGRHRAGRARAARGEHHACAGHLV